MIFPYFSPETISYEPFSECFAAEFIGELAREFGLDEAKLRQALESFYEAYLSARQLDCSMPHLERARKNADQDLDTLRRMKRRWTRFREVSEHELSVFGSSTDEIFPPLDDLIEALEQLGPKSSENSDGARNGDPTTDDEFKINLSLYHKSMIELDEFWIVSKGTHMGAGFQKKRPGKLDGDAGLRFAQKCLEKLDERFTLKHTASAIRRIRDWVYSSKPTRQAQRTIADM